MAKPAASAKAAPPRRKSRLPELGRLTLWAFFAAFFVTIAAYAGSTELGQRRMKAARAAIHEIFLPSGVTPPRPLDAREGQRLAENVRALAADRDRLFDRLGGLERQLEEVTGSIARVEKAANAAQQALAAAPQPAPPAAEDVTASVAPPAVPVPLPPPQPGAARQFALDLGSAQSVEGLRALWTATLKRYSPLLEGLYPVVQMRERRQAGLDLHLVVGPIPNAATAARLCATITAAGAVCQPASFEGQRLAVR